MISTESQQFPKIDFRAYLGVVILRWQIIALCFLYAMLGGVLYLLFTPKIYQTGCRVMIYRDPSLEILRTQTHWKLLRVHSVLLKSATIRNRVVDRLAGDWMETVGGRRRMALDVTVAPVRNAANTMLDVSVRSAFPEFNQRFLGSLLEEYRGERGHRQSTISGTATVVLSKELGNLAEQMKAAEAEMIDYQRRHNMTYIQEKASIESRYLQALMQRRNELKTEQILLEIQTPMLDTADAAMIQDITQLTLQSGRVTPLDILEEGERTSPRVSSGAGEDEREKIELADEGGLQNLRVELLRLGKIEEEQAKTFVSANPKLIATRKKIAEAEENLLIAARVAIERLKARKSALIRHQEALEAAENRWQAPALLASKRQSEYRRLVTVYERIEEMYQHLYSRLQDLRVSEQLKAEHFSVVEPIRTGGTPVWPVPLKVMLVVFAGGLGVGVGLTVLAHVMDEKIRTIRDMEEELGLQFLGGIPLWVRGRNGRASELVVSDTCASGAVEAYRALRTRLLQLLDERKSKVCMITSSDSKEGKTVTTLNLAVIVARMGKRVAIVDMDLRRGRLHQVLDQTRSPGMTELLGGRVGVSETVRKTPYENLDLVPCGAPVENISELLQTTDMARFFSGLAKHYDYVFVDTAPLLRVTDTVILSACEGVTLVMIAAAGRTAKPLVRYSLNLVNETKPLGIILNAINLQKLSSLYYAYEYPNYAYYSNAYAYGYGYGDDRPKGWGSRLRTATRRAGTCLLARLSGKNRYTVE